MRNIIKALVLGLFSVGVLSLATPALAASPILSATYQGGSVQLSISNANPYSQINLYSRQASSLWTVVNNIGQTDGNGNFNQAINLSTSGSSGNPLQIYVVVGGLQSSTVSVYPNGVCPAYGCGGCTYNCGSPYGLSLSQNSASLSVGQTLAITAYNAGYTYITGSFYVSSNSNSGVASASVSGNQINIYGISSGSSTISVCQNSGSSGCASIYVTVSGSSCTYYGCTNNGTISLSQNTLSLTSPQTANVSIYGSSYGGYYISSNSNSGAASASISGSTLYITSLFGGSTTITVCQNGGSGQCATLYVTVNGNGSGSGTLSLSQTSLSLVVGQSQVVNAYNFGSGSLYVSNNSNSSVVSTNVSGSQITFYGLQNGSSTVNICANSSQCASVYVTVSGNSCTYYGCAGGTLTFSPSSVNLNLGQSSTVSIYNSYSGSLFYVSSNSNSGVASASVSGSSLYLLAGSVGSTTITVCQNSVSTCGTLYVTVNNLGGTGNNTLSLSQTSLSLTYGQTAAVTAYNGSGIYVSSNSNSAVASYSISGNQINIYGASAGSTTLNICGNSGIGCASLYVTVSGTTCLYTGCGVGTGISLSQTTLSLGGGQTGAITIYGNGSYYVSSNSSPYVANALLSGNVINVTAIQNGTTTVTVCQNGGGSQCATLYITVGGAVYYGTTNVVLSQTSLSLAVGQSATVNASGNGGYGYYISSNSNPGAVSGVFNGSVLTVYGITNGSSSLLICQNGASSCATLYVTVSGAYPYGGTGASVLGASTYPNGELIAEGQTVYIVYRGTKTAFANASAFTGLGFSFNNIIQVGNSGLPNSGYIISTPYAAHPWGSWVKNGSTVYFVQELGLIPVPDWATFINNGGSSNLVVNANNYDFRLPILSPMTSNDSRLR